MKILQASLFIFSIFLVACTEDEPEVIDEAAVPSNNLNVGASAKQLLSGEHFKDLIVEIQYPQGYAPPAGSIADLEAFLNKYVDKPGGIEVITKEINVTPNNQYSVNEIRNVENNHRTAFNSENTMAIYLFLADGDYEENSNVLGIAHLNTSMALFQKRIQELSGGIGQPSERLVTSTVLNHEVGHILGLVNVGTPMVTEHQDTAHGPHCDDTSCLMYWTAETGNVIDNLLGMSTPPDLDAQCQNDLEALREK